MTCVICVIKSLKAVDNVQHEHFLTFGAVQTSALPQ